MDLVFWPFIFPPCVLADLFSDTDISVPWMSQDGWLTGDFVQKPAQCLQCLLKMGGGGNIDL